MTTADMLINFSRDMRGRKLATPNDGTRAQLDLDDNLVQAAFSGDLALVRWLLLKGARVDYWQDPIFGDFNMEEHTFKSSAILVACQQGHIDVVICLHQFFMRLKQEGPGCGSLGFDSFRHYWAILVETLKNRNKIQGRCVTKDDDGNDINIEADPFLQPFCFLDDLRLLKYLLDMGADINARGQSGKTPLMKAACSRRYASALNLLLESGADPNITGRQHYSALVCAVRNRNIPAIETLLKHGARLEHPAKDFLRSASDVNRQTPVCPALVFSIASGYIAETKLLLQHGARPMPIPRYLLYMLQVMHSGDLTSHADCVSFLFVAFYKMQPEIIQLLLAANFYCLKDLDALRGDDGLLWRIEVEEDYLKSVSNLSTSTEAEQVESIAAFPLGGLETDSTYNRAATTLMMLKHLTTGVPSLFSLTVMKVRECLPGDIWRGKKQLKEGELKLILRLPLPLVRSILYTSSCV